MFSVNIRAKSSCDILKSVGISRGIGIFFSPVRPQSRPSRTSVQQAIKKLSFSPENFGFPGFSFGFCYKALTYQNPRGQNPEMIDHTILRFDAKCLDVKGIVVVLRQHLQPLCSGCRIADGDLFLNGLACFWVNMPPYRFPHCIGPSSLSGHFLDASISVG